MDPGFRRRFPEPYLIGFKIELKIWTRISRASPDRLSKFLLGWFWDHRLRIKSRKLNKFKIVNPGFGPRSLNIVWLVLVIRFLESQITNIESKYGIYKINVEFFMHKNALRIIPRVYKSARSVLKESMIIIRLTYCKIDRINKIQCVSRYSPGSKQLLSRDAEWVINLELFVLDRHNIRVISNQFEFFEHPLTIVMDTCIKK